MTHEKIIQKINDNKKFEVIKFINSDQILLKCKVCGAEEIKKISQAIDKRCSCKTCYYKRKNDKAKQYLISLLKTFGSNYTLLEYNGKNELAKLKCNKCSNIIYRLPTNIKRNIISCDNKLCDNNIFTKRHEQKFSIQEISKEIKEKTNSEYSFISSNTDYILCETKIKIKHNICNKSFETTRGALLYRHIKCPYCKTINRQKNAFIDAQKELNDLSNNRFIITEETFISRKSIVEIYDTLYNEYFNISYCYFIRKLSGKIKNETTHVASHAEEYIAKYLDSHNIEYQRQKTFDDLVSIKYKKLFMDFFIQKYNLCIEYDGEYHYLNIFGESILKSQKHNDNIKNKYCKKNNINILRIPYWEYYRIDEILSLLFKSLDKNNSFITTKRKLKISRNKLND